MVRVVSRRAADLRPGIAVRLPKRVLVPVPVEFGADGHVLVWRWQVCRAKDLPGATNWRYLYEVGAVAGLETLRTALGDGFTALRVSADEPPAQVAPLIVAVGAGDLVDVRHVDTQQPVAFQGEAMEPVAGRYTLVGVWHDGRMLPVGIVPGDAEVQMVDTDELVWTLPIQTVVAAWRVDSRD
jgi:hypothetical protein